MIKEYILLGIVIIFASIVFNYFKNNRLLDINESGLIYLKLEYQYMQSHPKLIFKEINGLENPEIIENFNIKEDLTIYYKVRFYQSGIYRYTVVKSAISSNSFASGYGYAYGNGINNFNYRGNILNKKIDNTNLYIIDQEEYENQYNRYNRNNTSNNNFRKIKLNK